MTDETSPPLPAQRIVVRKNGPYTVYGGIPLVHKTQVVTEYGEPISWVKDAVIPTEEVYDLCRCGQSQNKPFCDGSHRRSGFDGTETADTKTNLERRFMHRGSSKIYVFRDIALCTSAGFCGNRFTNIQRMVPKSDEDTALRSLIIAMAERCPSGSYTYRMEADGPDIEPDLPVAIAVCTEISDDGPIMGPLWVTGNIAILRADGQPLEIRNRVTLCRCGLSGAKPLGDGAQRDKNVMEDL